jgi:hypothetical protein
MTISIESRRRILGPQGKCVASASTKRRLILYGTLGCHLCDEAQALVEALPEVEGWCLVHVDIVDDDASYERYWSSIPVLRREDDERELRWPFDADAVRRLLADR